MTITEQAVALAQRGIPPAEIARRVGSNRKSVSALLCRQRNAGVIIPIFGASMAGQRKYSLDAVAAVVRLYKDGHTYTAIGAATHMPPDSVVTIVRRELPGRTLRKPGRPRKERDA